MSGETPSNAVRRIFGLPTDFSPVSWLGRIDPVVLAMAGLFAGLFLFTPAQGLESLQFVGWSLIRISPFLGLSVAIAAAAKASGSEKLIARVFSGSSAKMIAAAAAFGPLSPFCSCGVSPIIAGLLGAGVPLAPVMAFWLSSPLMDPEMFILSSAQLGLHFTFGKTLAAFGLGLLGGFATISIQRMGFFLSPLSEGIKTCSAASCSSPGDDGNEGPEVLWAFWRDPARWRLFREGATETGWFLGKWLTLAFAIESLMLAFIPASLIADWLGGGSWWTIPAAVLVGVPAYLNGFAAIPLVSGLIDMGMAKGAAMAFMVAGGVTSIPAAVAVYAMVRRPVFVWYVGLSLTGSLIAGLLYQLSL